MTDICYKLRLKLLILNGRLNSIIKSASQMIQAFTEFSAASGKLVDGLIGMVVEQRRQAKAAKDWATSDRIRDQLKALGVQIKDTKDGCEWTIE